MVDVLCQCLVEKQAEEKTCNGGSGFLGLDYSLPQSSLTAQGEIKREAAVQSNRQEESVLVVMNLSNWIQELKPKPWKKWREEMSTDRWRHCNFCRDDQRNA
ncbi:hypothetical protein MUK42_32396 [Musa troglodytarum]|uniref:Uncharacterized protein n=1 Tax=Musa troglodytarum TaxID=320322 RepID=A0A9E7JYV9_9LILI|nr:hypothetical protein MUK42_32396 [Musa troglodytarum]